MEFEDGLDELVGEVVFGGEGQGLGVVRIDEEDFVVIGVEADAGFGDVVGDDEIAVLAGEFFAGVGFEVFGFRGEADEGAGETRAARGRSRGCPGF